MEANLQYNWHHNIGSYTFSTHFVPGRKDKEDNPGNIMKH